ncbi:MAG: ligase-associated DNA damage response endonuclease PdeM [Bacteroidota bacterium]
MTFTHKNQTLHLHPLKAIFWEEKKILFLADLHLGKAAHFRKGGLAAPAGLAAENFLNLENLLAFFNPVKVLFLGDLFHSQLNSVWEKFARFIESYGDISFELVKGNHDILPAAIYEKSVMKIHEPPLTITPFIFSHYPLAQVQDGLYNFYGHIHPGVLLEGLGKQELKLPCFYFQKDQAVLPAFGAFTGLAIVSPKSGEQVFVIAENEVIQMS